MSRDIHESGSHLLQIINDILDLSKAEAGKLELHEEVFDLRDTIRSVRQLISARIGDGGLSDSVELPADLPLLRADERKTKQVLLNLVINAVKFTPPGGHIEIAGRFDPEAGLIADGARYRHRHRAGRSRPRARTLRAGRFARSARSHQGTGLGLPLVKAIMERHGGTLAINSELGVGTQVSVTFPPWRAVFAPVGRAIAQRGLITRSRRPTADASSQSRRAAQLPSPRA